MAKRPKPPPYRIEDVYQATTTIRRSFVDKIFSGATAEYTGVRTGTEIFNLNLSIATDGVGKYTLTLSDPDRQMVKTLSFGGANKLRDALKVLNQAGADLDPTRVMYETAEAAKGVKARRGFGVVTGAGQEPTALGIDKDVERRLLSGANRPTLTESDLVKPLTGSEDPVEIVRGEKPEWAPEGKKWVRHRVEGEIHGDIAEPAWKLEDSSAKTTAKGYAQKETARKSRAKTPLQRALGSDVPKTTKRLPKKAPRPAIEKVAEDTAGIATPSQKALPPGRSSGFGPPRVNPFLAASYPEGAPSIPFRDAVDQLIAESPEPVTDVADIAAEAARREEEAKGFRRQASRLEKSGKNKASVDAVKRQAVAAEAEARMLRKQETAIREMFEDADRNPGNALSKRPRRGGRYADASSRGPFYGGPTPRPELGSGDTVRDLVRLERTAYDVVDDVIDAEWEPVRRGGRYADPTPRGPFYSGPVPRRALPSGDPVRGPVRPGWTAVPEGLGKGGKKLGKFARLAGGVGGAALGVFSVIEAVNTVAGALDAMENRNPEQSLQNQEFALALGVLAGEGARTGRLRNEANEIQSMVQGERARRFVDRATESFAEARALELLGGSAEEMRAISQPSQPGQLEQLAMMEIAAL